MTDRKVKIRPPEGGWGYAVAIGSALMFSCTVSTFQAFGLVFNDFLSQFGDVATSTTLIHTAFGTISSMFGICIGPLTAIYQLRTIGLCGALLYFMGAFLTVFAANLVHLVLAYGVLQGSGFGLMMPVVLTSVNNYFDKKRPFINNMFQALICFVNVFIPYGVQYCMDAFGFRGTLAILAAISLHNFLAMLIMQPVEWHMQYSTFNQNGETLKEIELKDIQIIDGPNDILQNKLTDFKVNQNEKNASKLCLNDENTKTWWHQIIDSLDLSLLKNPIYMNTSIGIALLFVADFTFLTLAPMLLLHRNFNAIETATCIMSAAIADLISRSCLALISSCIFIKSRYIVFAGGLITLFLRLVWIFDISYVQAIVLFASIGFIRTWIQTPIPLCFAEQIETSRFPAAWGLYMVIYGILGFVIGPSIGMVSTIFQNDDFIIYALSIYTLICLVPWSIEFFLTRYKNNK